MDDWESVLQTYADELRQIAWLKNLGVPSNDRHIIDASNEPVVLDHTFWSLRTHETESAALRSLNNDDIDRIFDDVAGVMDEDLSRFDSIITYFGEFYPDPVDAGIRMEHETEMAHSVKRDLAWIAVERVIQQPDFFSGLLDWYTKGRWPFRWHGKYPEGHVICL